MFNWGIEASFEFFVPQKIQNKWRGGNVKIDQKTVTKHFFLILTLFQFSDVLIQFFVVLKNKVL